MPFIQSAYSQQTSTTNRASISIYPTDDAFVVVSPDDPDDLAKLQTVNTGNEKFLEIWSNHSISPEFNETNALSYLKFDLKNFDEENMKNAYLRIWTLKTNFESEEEIELFYVRDNNWKESDITYLSRPIIDSEPITTLEIPPLQTWHNYDITEIVKNGVRGALVSVGDSQNLVQTIQSLLSDQERLLTMGQNAAIDFAEEWNWETYAQNLTQVYEEVRR